MIDESDPDKNRVSIVIVNYNGGDHIVNCLDAIANQTVIPDSVIVVDNNSSDGSSQAIQEKYAEVTLIQLRDNIGFAGANNRAFEYLTDIKWVALLNPDTLPFENWLERMLEATKNHADCDMFASQLVDATENSIYDGAGDIFHVSGLSWRRHHGISKERRVLRDDPVFSPCAAAALYSLQAVRSVGGFDENYFCYNEDVDLVFRLRLIGKKCYYVEDAIVAHVGSALTGKDSDFSVYHGHRNLVWTYFKNMPGWLVIKYLPQHLLLNFVSLVYYTLRGRGGIIWRSKWHALKGLGSAFKKRKTIQSSRTANNEVITENMTKGLLRPYLSRFQ